MYNVRTLKYMLTLEIRAYSEIEILRNIFQKCNKNYFIIKKTLPLCLVPTVVMTFIAQSSLPEHPHHLRSFSCKLIVFYKIGGISKVIVVKR